jgi:hypothetical protein
MTELAIDDHEFRAKEISCATYKDGVYANLMYPLPHVPS